MSAEDIEHISHLMATPSSSSFCPTMRFEKGGWTSETQNGTASSRHIADGIAQYPNGRTAVSWTIWRGDRCIIGRAVTCGARCSREQVSLKAQIEDMLQLDRV